MNYNPKQEENQKKDKELDELLLKTRLESVESLDFLKHTFDIINNIQFGMHIYHLKDINDDRSLMMVAANLASETLTGIKVKDVVGKTLDENFPGLREKGVPQMYAEVIRTKQIKEIEDLYYTDDRVIAGAFGVKAFPLANNHVCVSFENITKRKQQEQELIQSRKDWQEIFCAIGQPTLILDKNQNILEANQASIDLLNLSLEEIKGKKCYDFFHNGKVIHDCPFERLLNKGKSETIEMEVESFNRFFLVSCTPIYDDKGDIQKIIHISTDITERRLMEQDLKNMNEEYESINEELRETNERLYETNREVEENKSYLNSILRSSPIGIGVVVDRVITYVNDLFFEITGYTCEEILGKSSRILYPDDETYNLVGKEKYNQIKEKGIGTVETKWRTKKGEILDILLSSSPIDLKDLSKGVTFTALNITERKKYEKNIQESEEKYRSLFEQAIDGIVITDSKGIILNANNSISVISGYKQNEMINNEMNLFFSQDEIAKNPIRFDLLEQGLTLIKERLLTRKDKNVISVEMMIKKLPDQRYQCFIKDLTPIKKSQDELKLIFELSADMICIATMDGFFKKINPAFTKVLGYTEQELLSNPFFKYIHPDDLESTKLIIEEKLKLNIPIFQFENRYICKDGKIKWLSWVSQPFINEGLIYAITRDITERKKIELEIIEAKEKAEESDRLKTAFLANMSHEIRTPMNGILGFTELLKDENLDSDKKKQFINVINNNGKHLISIIDDIIDLSRIEANQINIVYKECNLNELMNDLYIIFQNKISQERNNEIKIKIFKHLKNDESYIVADINRLRQIMFNLLVNAIKFTKEGYVEFGYIIKDREIIFSVKDTGIGIPIEKQSYIFDRFRQVDETHTRKYGGTGLGLTISKKLIDLMNGRIWLESKPEVGSTFLFTIPYLPTEKKEEIKKQDHEELSKINFSEKCFLIVEDNYPSYKLIETFLEKTNVKILYASNGQDAITMFKKNKKIDLVLLDLQIPVIDGFEVVKQIKKLKPKQLVIAQTAYAMKEDRNKCLQAGFDEYITKPIEKDKLLEAILSIL